MSHYTHFTTEEREQAMVFLSQGFNLRAIALKLKRNVSSISREISRNSNQNGKYSASAAEKEYRKRRKKCCRKPLLYDEELREYVLERMHLKWTPEQIAGRAKLEKYSKSFSHTTIYRAINQKILPVEIRKEMRFRWKYKHRKPYEKRAKITDAVNISKRPKSVEARKTFGHWESDTVLGQRKTGAFATHVERKSGYLIALKLENIKDETFNRATVDAFQHLPSRLKKTFTVDNGSEFFSHKYLAEQTKMNVFFCDPYSPWQRGTNENTNGLLRQFFPKKTSFASVSQDLLDNCVAFINHRPRKRLGWKAPAEVLHLV